MQETRTGYDQADVSARELIRHTRRVTRRRFTPEEKVRIVIEGIRGEIPISTLCRREGIRTALSGQPDIQVVGEAKDGLEAEELALKVNPEVIVMDIYMPGRNGLESMLSIQRSLPAVKVLFLTVSDQEEDLLRAIRFGAAGYLLKRSAAGDIVNGVRRVAAGESILSPSMAARVMKELREAKREPALSDREQEMLELVSQGRTNSEIAAQLSVTQSTVSTYVYRLLQKLHLRNRAEAIAHFIRRNTRSEPL